MLEKMKAISNPLTIVGLFCGVVEVVGLIVMGTGNLAPEAQRDLIWLVKWFPILLVLLFFITLWFKDRVLYAPGDFKDEKNYLDLARADAKQGLAIGQFQGMLDDAIPKIVSEVAKTVSVNGADERRKIEEAVQSTLQPVQSFADKLRLDKDRSVLAHLSFTSDADRRAAFSVWRLLSAESNPMTLKEIASKRNLHSYAVSQILYDLIRNGFVEEHPDNGDGRKYSATSF
jgi:hypothetical protein